MVSSALQKPCIMLNPETLAVIEPNLIAARAVVERWPMDITGTITSVYSSKWVLRMRRVRARPGKTTSLETLTRTPEGHTS